MRKKSAEEVLELLMRHLIVGIEELFDYKNIEGEEFQYGERVAYTECLECLQQWTNADRHGLDFDIEKRYPLFIASAYKYGLLFSNGTYNFL